MTVCNMAIEAGARAGLIGVDETTIAYLRGRPYSPTGLEWSLAESYWRTLHSDADARWDAVVTLDASEVRPQVTVGHLARDGRRDRRSRPRSRERARPGQARRDGARAQLHGARAELPVSRHPHRQGVHRLVHELAHRRLREAAAVVRRLGARVAKNVKLAMVVPGSGLVKEQAEREGLDLVFKGAGFEWREPGCSMCLAMNADRLEPGERCASTSNRNFEGRQGAGGRTHLVSPAMAAAAAIEGHFVDVRRLA
jgi:3-isopropylmalate/(R)-2-methylmalate dehydratase large subunit